MNYYLCSSQVIDELKPNKASKPITIYKDVNFLKEDVYIAWIDFKDAELKYNELEKIDANHNFWFEELVNGQMNVDSIDIDSFINKCPFDVIEEELGLTKMNNIAMAITNICDNLGYDPIEFWNEIKRLQ